MFSKGTGYFTPTIGGSLVASTPATRQRECENVDRQLRAVATSDRGLRSDSHWFLDAALRQA